MVTRSEKWKEFESDLKAITEGKRPPPNLEEIPAATMLYSLAGGWRPAVDGRIFDPRPGYGPRATYYLGNGQNGLNDGGGYVIWDAGWDADAKSCIGKAARFAICKHKKTEEGHNPNHSRGWHPGHCELCGIDMSVDSGD